jgi:hypothetical protein
MNNKNNLTIHQMPYILQTKKKAWLASLSRELVLLGPGYLNAEEGHTSVSLLFDPITSVHLLLPISFLRVVAD